MKKLSRSTMKTYRLEYSEIAIADLQHLALFTTAMHTLDFARRYTARLRSEIESLSYLADMLPKSKYRLPLLYHPEAKTLPVGNNRLTVIFHIDGETVFIDKILPSAMMTH